ncbi:leucine-rich repeat domain-containing protein [Paenibacillus roseipurpureus]|uniref:Leucine-rich repeat domain-containing protein n=1 Tax=Paenibacillus roseopurpureus TaxID=2918901 RepID=A0AA96LR77_9BACL|nr:leucine-rich repeat domain-containing protein [Paenibacillus sp. MBLB1832]WNR45788.1 leucine-rich repeat domain-containing protein [Paenibacillus sp. MBLB1832]
MKKLLILFRAKVLLLCFLLLIFTLNYDNSVKASGSLIQDHNLEIAIRDVLQKYSGEITKDDLDNLDTLYQTRKGSTVSSLKGLEYAKNLYSLYFSNNNISDVSPIANLPKLTKLSLGSNKLNDIRALESLPNLTNLSLDHNQINDISVLSNFPNLEQLSINHNQIKSIDSISSLTKLTFLNIEENQISDISATQTMKKINLLMANNNQIHDISPLANSQIFSIQMNNNKLENLAPLATMKELGNLRIAGNQIKDISPLANLNKLTLLELADNRIEDITPLKNLKSIAGLYMSKNLIQDISPLKETNFRTVDLRENRIQDIKPLAQMNRLQHVLLSKNNINDIQPLEYTQYLSEVDLSANPLNEESISSIEKIKQHGTIVKSGDLYYKHCSFDCIYVYLNGQEKQVENRIFQQDGRILISLREIFEMLGATVTWDPNNYEITAQKGLNKVTIQIDSKESKINDNAATMDVAPTLISNITYVPIRFVSEAIGADVNWDETSQRVLINSK